MIKYSKVLLLVLSLAMMAINASAYSGSGTAGNPYLISSITDLDGVAKQLNQSNTIGVYVKLVNNINGEKNPLDIVYGRYSYIPAIGTPTHPFEGTFDGNGFTITYVVSIAPLAANLPAYPNSGFFGLTKNATIKNLKLSNCSVWGGNGTTGVVDGGDDVGGLIGSSTGNTNVINCYFSGNVSSIGNNVGGLIGNAQSGTVVMNSFATALVRGVANIGGFVGKSTGASFTNCYSTSAAEGLRKVSNSSTGGNIIGGFAGFLDATSNLINTYATGLTTGYSSLSAFAAQSTATISNAYFDKTVSGAATATGTVGLTSDEFRVFSNFTSYPWGIADATPWVKPSTSAFFGAARPFLFWQKAMVSNSNVNDLAPNNEMRISIKRKDGETFTIVESGVRIRRITVDENWTLQSGGPTNLVNNYLEFTFRIKNLTGNQAYYFQAYCKDSDGEFHFGDVVKSSFVSEYQVTYNKNDAGLYAVASGSVTDTELYRNNLDEATAKANGYSSTGYTFNSWNTAANGSGVKYEVGNKFKLTAGQTLYAQWIPVKYTITYEKNDGNDAINPTVIAIGSETEFNISTETFTLKTPTRAGYTFGGWYTVAYDLTTTPDPLKLVTTITKGSTSNVSVYARWFVHAANNKFTVSYQANDGGDLVNPAIVPAPKDFYVTTDAFSLDAPSRSGYSFGGWYTQAYSISQTPDASKKVSEITKGTSKSVSVYAYWYVDADVNKQTLTYLANDGADAINPAIIPSVKYFYVTDDTFSLPAASRTGYSFGGWYTVAYGLFATPDPAKEVKQIVLGTTQNVTVYARWYVDAEVNKYTLSYQANDGEDVNNQAIIPSTKTFFVTDNTFTLGTATRSGYSFGGWYTEAYGLTAIPDASKKVLEVTKGTTKNVTVYAHWFVDPAVNKYVLKYHANDDELNVATIPMVRNFYVTDATFSLESASRIGYTFGGWYTVAYGALDTPDANKKLTEINKGTVKDINVYAYWYVDNTTNKYKLTYNANDDALNPAIIPGVKQFYVTDAAFALEVATRTGYTFGGWYTVAYGVLDIPDASKEISEVKKGTTSNITVYAYWYVSSGSSYSLTYKLNDDVLNPAYINPAARTSFYVNTPSFILEDATRPGYSFGGWYTVAYGITDTPVLANRVAQVNVGTSANIEVYAHWFVDGTNNKFILTYNANDDAFNRAVMPSNKDFVVTDADFSLEDASRSGYSFGGWYTQAYSVLETPDPIKKVDKVVRGTAKNIDVYAFWFVDSDVNNLTLTYYANDDLLNPAIIPSNKNFLVTTADFSLEAATRSGYSFGGWYTQAYGILDVPDPLYKVTEITTGTSSNVSVYAHWFVDPVLNKFTITFMANDGGDLINPATIPSPKDLYVTDAKYQLPLATRNGYTFDGWYTQAYDLNEPADAFQKISHIEMGSTTNLTVYAHWMVDVNVNSYQLTYLANDDNDQINPASIPNSQKFVVTDATFSLLDANRAGYSFGGWYTEAYGMHITPDPTKKVTLVTKGTTTNVTVYAYWFVDDDANKFTLSYMPNDGDDVINPAYVPSTTYFYVSDETFELLAASRSGYTFGGWYSVAYGLKDTPQASNKVAFVNQGTSKNIVVYAYWYVDQTSNRYTITYDLNDGGDLNYPGVLSPNAPDVFYVSTPSFQLLPATREGYQFKGWFEDVELLNSKNTIKEGSVGNVNVYASWAPVDYPIVYNLNGGVNHVDNPASYQVVSSAIVLQDPTKIGYIFDGWYSDDAFKNQVVKITAGSNGGRAYFAKWKIEVGIVVKWNYVLAIDDQKNILKPVYQWYKDGVAIEGATKVSFAGDNKMLCGVYTCQVILKSTGESFFVLPYTSTSDCDNIVSLRVVPSLVGVSRNISIYGLEGARKASTHGIRVDWYDMNGVKVLSQSHETVSVCDFTAPNKPGFYILSITDGDNVLKRERISVY